MPKVVFDTNVFNHLVEGGIAASKIPTDWEPIATHIQRDEIAKTANEVKRAALDKTFAETIAVQVPTESAVYGVSRYDQSKWTGPASIYYKLKDELDAIKKKPNNVHDALIADTCVQNGYVLVTNDGALKAVAAANGCEVVDLHD